MRNYKFSLESVLEVRCNEEKNVLEDFVVVQNSLAREEKVKNKLKNKLDCFLKKGNCKNNVRDLTMGNLYKVNLESKIENQSLIVAEKRAELEAAREKLELAQRDKKMMEKLKEKDLGRYKSEISKENQKEIDEFAVLRFKTN